MLIPPPYAIDLGDRSVKIAQLVPRQRWHAGYPSPRMRFFIERDLQAGWIVGGTITDPAPLAAFIRRIIHERIPSLVRSPFVISALPEQRTFLTTTVVPDGGRTSRGEALRRAMGTVMPIDVNSATVASAPIIGASDRIAVAAAPTAVVESHAALFARVHLTPLALVTEAEALARAVAYGTAPAPIQPTRNSSLIPHHSSLILDLGATRTGAIIANGASVAASITIPTSGIQLTAAIAAKLRIESAAAERAKRGADLARASQDDPTATTIAQALEPIVTGIASLRTFVQHHFHAPLQPTRIVLTGGGAALRGLDAFLKQRCKLDVTTFVIPSRSAPTSGRTTVPTSHLALVFGLGLMALDPANALNE